MKKIQISLSISLALIVIKDWSRGEAKNSTYCAIQCGGETHTMCKYENVSNTCENFIISYSPSTGESALHDQNYFRNALANASEGKKLKGFPSASNMRLMTWDRELAKIAHRWLSQCIMGHDQCRDTKQDKVGQNIGFVIGSEITGEFDIPRIFTRWENENLNVTDIESYSEKNDTMNISQLLWAETYRVGCSEVTYKSNNVTVKAFACNYAPKGNIAGMPIYQAGDPCKSCPAGTKCGVDENFMSLCGRDGDLSDPEDFQLDLSDEENPVIPPNVSTCSVARPFPVLLLATSLRLNTAHILS